MNNEANTSKWKKIVNVILLILVVAEIPLNAVIIGLGAVDIIPRIGAAVNVVALAYAALYMLMGYQKQAATGFKGFVIFFSITLLIACASCSLLGSEIIYAVIEGVYAISFGCSLVIVVAKDLKWKKSITLCGVITAINFVMFVIIMIFAKGVSNGGNLQGSVYQVRSSAMLLGSVILIVMMYAKYEDKKARGREV